MPDLSWASEKSQHNHYCYHHCDCDSHGETKGKDHCCYHCDYGHHGEVFLWVETRPGVLRHGPADLLVTLDKPCWQPGAPSVG